MTRLNNFTNTNNHDVLHNISVFFLRLLSIIFSLLMIGLLFYLLYLEYYNGIIKIWYLSLAPAPDPVPVIDYKPTIYDTIYGLTSTDWLIACLGGFAVCCFFYFGYSSLYQNHCINTNLGKVSDQVLDVGVNTSQIQGRIETVESISVQNQSYLRFLIDRLIGRGGGGGSSGDVTSMDSIVDGAEKVATVVGSGLTPFG